MSHLIQEVLEGLYSDHSHSQVRKYHSGLESQKYEENGLDIDWTQILWRGCCYLSTLGRTRQRVEQILYGRNQKD